MVGSSTGAIVNIIPIAGFYFKHGSQISALLPKSSGPSQSSLLLDVADALAPVVKRHWPQLNANGLVDDAVKTLHEMFAPAPVWQPPEPGAGG